MHAACHKTGNVRHIYHEVSTHFLCNFIINNTYYFFIPFNL